MFRSVAILSAVTMFGVLVFAGFGHAEDAEYKPSWQAMCGYKWRNSTERVADKSRTAYTAFMRKPEADGGCGAKASRNGNDDKIKAYLDAHPVGPKTDASDIENMSPWQEARGRKH